MARMSNTEELERLLVGPYRWSSATYCSFILVAYNVIIEEMDRLHNIHENAKQAGKKKKLGTHNQTGANDTQKYDQDVAQFVEDVIKGSNLVFGNENWVDIIRSDWDLLKLNQRGVDICKLDDSTDAYVLSKKTSAIHLFKLIRDKLSHLKTYKGVIKGEMTYFFDKDYNEVYQFNENKFVSFWISKFPKLMPYLWLVFYRFKSKLAYYYPDDDIKVNLLQDSLLDLNQFEEELQQALVADTEKGNLLKRFKGEKCSLEFREYYNTVKIRDNYVIMKFVGSSNDNVSLLVSNSTTKEDILKYVGTAPRNETFILIFTDNIEDDEIWKYCINCDCRVVLFCDPKKLGHEIIQNAVDNFRNGFTFKLAESPIRYCELSVEKQEWIHNLGQLCIQDKDMKLKQIFADRSTMAEVLTGELLNKLLRQEKPNILKCKYPEYKGIYIERKLYFNEQYLERSTEKCKSDDSCVRETEFMQRVHSARIKTVCISAESGMGKSKLLISLGKRLTNSFVIFCSFRHFVDLLKKRVTKEECSRSDIKFVLFEILKCEDNFERNVVDKWLDRKCGNGILIDLQLDALDEVPRANSKLALKAWKIIDQDFDSIRLWITSSQSFPSESREHQTAYCNICPFSENDKMKYFILAWSGKSVELLELGRLVRNLFAHFCTFTSAFVICTVGKFLDYPLNCSMLTELYEDKLTNVTPFRGSALDLYDALCKKRFCSMYKKMYGFVDENSGNFRLLRESYFQLHTYMALKYLFPENSKEFEQPVAMRFLNAEDYHKMGIITGIKPVTFVHNTYAEFFVARYIIKVSGTYKVEYLCSKKTFGNLLNLSTAGKRIECDESPIWKFVKHHLENKEGILFSDTE